MLSFIFHYQPPYYSVISTTAESDAVNTTLIPCLSRSALFPSSLSSLLTFIVPTTFVGIQFINIVWTASASTFPAAIKASTLVSTTSSVHALPYLGNIRPSTFPT